MGIKIRFSWPWSFWEKDTIIFKQWSLTEMELCDRSVVVNKRSEISAFCLSPSSLGIKQLIKGCCTGIIRSLYCLNLSLSCYTSIEIRLCKGKVSVNISYCFDQCMWDFKLLILKLSTGLCQLQLVMPHSRQFPTKTKWHQELGTCLPFLKFSMQ